MNNLSELNDYIDEYDKANKEVESVVNAYFSSLDYDKYNIRPLNVNHFCKELRMNDEDVAKVHKLIKERLVRIKLEQIEGDFT